MRRKCYLEVYAAEKTEDFVRKAILVIPGGGYTQVCSEREGKPIALAFMSYGYNAFVLHYSAGKSIFPTHLIEASCNVGKWCNSAIAKWVDNAVEWAESL